VVAPERLQEDRFSHQTEIEEDGIQPSFHRPLGIQRLTQPLRVEDALGHQELTESSIAHSVEPLLRVLSDPETVF
jgi:hypothetical protein